MIVSQFQSWAETAPTPARADGVSALARAFLYSNLDRSQSREAVRALTGFLDDPSPLVRLALAYAFASAADAPHHIVLALAEDQPEIAAVILGRSPILTDAELVDCVATAPREAQCAIASRYVVGVTVTAALAALGSREALVVLAQNLGADLSDASVMRMIARHGDHAPLREALLARDGLPIEARAALVGETANALMVFVTGRAWMSPERAKRVTREATEKTTIAIAAEAADDGINALTSYLRETSQLTVALALRAVLSGNGILFDAILGDLSGVAATRVRGLTRDFQSAGFAALYRKADFPLSLLPAFRIALAASRDHRGPALSLDVVERVIADCQAIDDGRFQMLMVLLRRFEAEAAREEARAVKAAPAALTRSPDFVLTPAVDTTLVDAPEEAPPMGAWPDTLSPAIHFDEAIPTERAPRAVKPAPFTIDFAALEAELMAA